MIEPSASPSSPGSFDELILEYRKLRHDVNNSLAAMMAHAELAERRPDYVPKLIAIVLERSQLTVEQMAAFHERMERFKVAKGR
ncbi:MAG TPA: hypothetical protein VIT91_19795 [Chthoniobacterales bacterium]